MLFIYAKTAGIHDQLFCNRTTLNQMIYIWYIDKLDWPASRQVNLYLPEKTDDFLRVMQ